MSKISIKSCSNLYTCIPKINFKIIKINDIKETKTIFKIQEYLHY